MEVETVKATVEIEAPSDGVLATIAAPEGATVKVNAVIGTIEG
ncbi:biotin/lipoyl-containing protein [Bradyrhizobium sp. PMVTL-01]